MKSVDIVFSLDTTDSMYPCLTQVRRSVVEATKFLFDRIPNLRIGVIAHGDYCDGRDCLRSLPLTANGAKVVDFINTAPMTNGGDSDECYEYVLNHARAFDWNSDISGLVLVGDALPHPYNSVNAQGHIQYDWRNEAKNFIHEGGKIYPVQAMGRPGSTHFYEQLALMSGTPKLDLPQFADIVDILTAICFQQAGQLGQFEETVRKRKVKPSVNVLLTLDKLAGRDVSKRSSVVGSRYQVLEVPFDVSIKDFVESNGLPFTQGRGFYEFTKKEEIQEYKEVVAQNLASGAIVIGKRARKVLGIPEGRVNVKPSVDSHIGFIQSTSVNRKLKAGTKFLYEIVDKELSV